MKDEYLKELEALVKDFLIYSNRWLQDGIIDEDTYTEIKNKKVKFIKDIDNKKV